MEEWEAFRHKGNVGEDYMNEPALRPTLCCLFMYVVAHSSIHLDPITESPSRSVIQMNILPPHPTMHYFCVE